jgi:hypothetical protein
MFLATLVIKQGEVFPDDDLDAELDQSLGEQGVHGVVAMGVRVVDNPLGEMARD